MYCLYKLHCVVFLFSRLQLIFTHSKENNQYQNKRSRPRRGLQNLYFERSIYLTAVDNTPSKLQNIECSRHRFIS